MRGKNLWKQISLNLLIGNAMCMYCDRKACELYFDIIHFDLLIYTKQKIKSYYILKILWSFYGVPRGSC